MFKLRCTHQKYAWGKSGDDSEVAKIVKDGHHDEAVDASKPYAEFWMGVHPNGPSKLAESGQSLAEFIKCDPAVLGSHEEGTLQFLFKVLSVKSALSVQTHPTKEQAKVLRAKDPKNYPDDNHKPEMAIALTDFQLLCGFRPAGEIVANLEGCPEIAVLLGADADQIAKISSTNAEESESALKTVFSRIWKSPQADITTTVASVIARISFEEPKSALDSLMIRLDREYPGGDVGVLAPLFLNYFTLSPGQSTFLGPNRPHAYLFGDCIECMACSDNTIRAGLTPKFKDTETLCANLEYKMSPPPLFQSEDSNSGIRLYAPPVPEFAVEEIKAGASLLPSHSASSLCIVIQGSAVLSTASSSLCVSRGDVIFLSANAGPISIAPSADFLSFRAFTPTH